MVLSDHEFDYGDFEEFIYKEFIDDEDDSWVDDDEDMDMMVKKVVKCSIKCKIVVPHDRI